MKNYEEFVATKQTEQDSLELMIFCLCSKREIRIQWVDSGLKFRIYRTERSLWPMHDNFTILKQRADLERPTFPINPWLFGSRAAILDCRTIHGNGMGISGNVFESQPAREGPPWALFEQSRKLASSSYGLGPDTTGNTLVPECEMIRLPQNTSILVPCFQKGDGVLHHTGWTFSHNGMMDYPRFPISEMHLGKFPDSLEFQSWKVTSMLKYVRNQQILISQCTG